MASFTNLDALRQMGLVSTYFDSQGRLRLKISCAGTGITYTGSMDSALIISAVKQQMTVDNIGLHGIVWPMSGMMTEYVPLPTVEMINSRIGTIDSVGRISSWSNGDSAYQWRSIGGVYSLYTTENTLYIVCCGRIDNTTASNAVFHGFDAEFDLQGHIKITNNTGSTYSNAYSSLSYVCKNSSATVITVYDSSNNPYNAFQYTSDGTDYYYVLDGVQTDWTDDLTSIGYKLPIVGWLGDDKQPKTVNGNGKHLYDINGNYVMYESPFNSFTYTILGYYSSESGTMQSPIAGLSIGGTPAGSSGGILAVIYYPGYSSSVTIQRVIYFKTPTS